MTSARSDITLKASATSTKLMFIPDLAGTTQVHNPRADNVTKWKGNKGNRGNRDEKGRESKANSIQINVPIGLRTLSL